MFADGAEEDKDMKFYLNIQGVLSRPPVLTDKLDKPAAT
jgi:hypothetical protein